MDNQRIFAYLEGLGAPESIVQFLSENWEPLAAMAYGEFLKKGKGLVFIDWLNEIPVKTPLSVVSIYLTPNSRAWRTILQGHNPELFRLVREYDPEESLVVRWNDVGIIRTRSILGLGSDRPLNCYETLKERLSEFKFLLSELK